MGNSNLRSMSHWVHLHVALVAAMSLADVQSAYAECDASKRNPNHVRIEKLARSYVYYQDGPSVVAKKKAVLARKVQLLDRLDQRISQELEKQLNRQTNLFLEPTWQEQEALKRALADRQELKTQIDEEQPILNDYLKVQGHLDKMLEHDGFKLIDDIEGPFDLQVHVYQDRGSPGQTYIVFRGTEGTSKNWDIIVDLLGIDPDIAETLNLSVGGGQYYWVEDELREWAKTKYPNAVVTGQSLGAALAQIYIADFPGSVREGVLFNAPSIRQTIVNQFIKAVAGKLISSEEVVRKALGPDIWSYVVKGDAVSLFGGEAQLPARIIELFGGPLANTANTDITAEERARLEKLTIFDYAPRESDRYFQDQLKLNGGLVQHREYVLREGVDIECESLSNEQYQEKREGHKPYSPGKAANAIKVALEMLTPDQLTQLKNGIQAEIDIHKWYEFVVGDATEGKNALYGSIMDRIDKVLELRKGQGNSAGQIASNPPLPGIHIHRPPAWGVGK
jgi:pimeloyl-ACP methyl ester carboxylesterase/molecular chaperone GrpE (heat shock protein)